MNVFLTGATGLLGINTVHSLLQHGHSVHALVRDPKKAQRVLPADKRITISVGDISTPDAWLPLLSKMDALIHTAAYFREYFGPGEHETKLCALNIDLPVRLAQAAEKYRLQKTIMVSSSGVVFGRANGAAADETDTPKASVPENRYAVSKVEMENALQKLAVTHPLIIIRPGWLFGPYDYAPTAAGEMVQRLLRTGTVQLSGGTPLGIADARDVAEGMVLALEKANVSTIYNLAGNSLTAVEALREIARQAGKGRIQQVPLPLALLLSSLLEPISQLRRKANPIPKAGLLLISKGVLISSEKAKRELGVAFRPFAETARDSVRFFREQQ